MKRILTAIIIALTVSACTDTSPAKVVTEKEAVRIAKQQLVTARPDLEIREHYDTGGEFVPAGPTSGGGPKWVIGFWTTDRKTGWKWIYYVTVFPDGRT